MRFLKSFFVITLVAVLALSVAACGSAQEEKIEVGYVNWACATASSYLVKNIIQEELDVKVDLIDMQAGLMWQSVETGDLDFIVCAWLPGTHAEYYDKVQGDVENVGANYEGAKIGLVVPEYVDIDSIEELNDYADEFGGNIVGIDAGAGIMGATKDAIEEYGLNLSLQESNDATMCAELSTAIQNQEWIVVTGWTPHWKFADFDLKFLDDPKGIYGDAETINTITRKEFSSDHPKVQAFLDNYFLTDVQLASAIGMMEEYDDKDEAAQAWIEENRDLVDSWLAE